MNNLYMKDLISKEYKHLLYKDESPELCDFLILKFGEVYRYSENTVRVISFLSSKVPAIKKICPVLYEWSTDDGLYMLEIENRFLPQIIELGATKKRIFKNGNFLKKLEEKLGHKILAFNPNLKEPEYQITGQKLVHA